MGRPKGSKKLIVKKMEPKPEPKAETVKKPVLGEVCKCGHGKEMHYGGAMGWCNICACQVHQA